MEDSYQQTLWGNKKNISQNDALIPADAWDQEFAKRSLDELFRLTFQYRRSEAYYALLQFVGRFRFYSPFNAMLVHIQKPGATYVAPPHRWLRDYGRRIRPGAHPLVILQPKGPVMFVFDVSDTEPAENAKSLPIEVEKPFEVRKGHIGSGLEYVIENAKRDGLRITNYPGGSQSAGSIQRVANDVRETQEFHVGVDKHGDPITVDIPVSYELLINNNLKREAQYVTIVHELAHLYCGHLGTPNDKWWPDRRGLKTDVVELEAESVAYMICVRFGIDNPSEQYLVHFIGRQEQVPSLSLECVMKAAGLIESMSRRKMKPRKQSDHED